MSAGCRDQCASAGEPLAGSAGEARVFIAVSWPKRLWHPDRAALSEGLPSGLAELEDRAKASGDKLSLRVFQRATGTRTEGVELILYRRGGGGFRAPNLPLERVVRAARAGLSGGEPDDPIESLGRDLLVCTDGQHDDCCARFGRPVYRAVCEEVEKRGSELRVAECSHLGGHRFAANALALPAGDLYGRVEPRDAPGLVRALDRGRVLRYRYRGRLGAGEAHQVADSFLAARLPEGCEWELLEAQAEPGDHVQVRARVHSAEGSREVVVHCRAELFCGPDSCGASAETRRRWVPVEIQEAA